MVLPLSTHTLRQFFGWFLILAALMWGVFCQASNLRLIADEQVHARQIAAFLNGRWELHPLLTLFPLYHAMIAGLSKMTGADSLLALRLFHLLLSLPLLIAFVFFCRKFSPANGNTVLIKALQVFSLPIVFILFFVLYADLPSLAAVFFMLTLTYFGKLRTAAIVGLLAILIRQTNLIWILLAVWWVVRGAERLPKSLPLILKNLTKAWPFLIIFLLALTAVILHGSIAIGDAAMHKISINFSNFYFFLLTGSLLLLPLNIAALPGICRLIRRNWWVLIVIACAFPIFWYSYNHIHPYNTVPFYLRNQLLMLTVDFPAWRAIAFILMAWMALTFVIEAARSDNRQLMLEIALISVPAIVLPPLIEQRYYLATFALFFALRSRSKQWAEIMQIIYGLAVSTVAVYFIAQMQFFF